MDQGECPKIHELALRADYELASKTKDYFYDVDVSPNCDQNGVIIIYTYLGMRALEGVHRRVRPAD